MTNNGRNEKILFWASFFTLIAAGMGFSIRGAILGDWGKQFGFTKSELGGITGGGLTGFCVGIFFFSLLTDKLGYYRIMMCAFTLHVLSAVVTLSAGLTGSKEGAYECLYWGSFIFATANGTCEAVINPLVATLFPKNKTHYLNILHAGWPGGLILGALLGLAFEEAGTSWQVQMAVFLVPTAFYGLLMFGRPFPTSEAKKSGVSMGTMALQFASPILLFLLVLHAMVGYVELGTDSWISNITGGILEDKQKGLMLFLWTSSLMFILRFFAGPIVHQISPLGLLFFSAILASLGLLLLGNSDGVFMCVLAATVYGLGKTFFWPTMLGVVSERFPKGGALALGIVGGVGMLSAGFLGGPGIGYKQDYFASKKLESLSPDAYGRYKAMKEDKDDQGNVKKDSAGKPIMVDDAHGFLSFPVVTGLDGSKVPVLIGDPGKDNGMGKGLEADVKTVGDKIGEEKYAKLNTLNQWWLTTGQPNAKADDPEVKKAVDYGGRQALIYTAIVPAMMAIGYLLLILYFRAIGGYRQIHIESHAPPPPGGAPVVEYTSSGHR